SLLKVILIIGLCSASTFVLIQMTGIISIEKIEIWFNQIRNISPLYLGGFVILLMFIDLFISIPTLATVILAGHFMGYQYGALVAIIGLEIAGNTGYFLGRIFGDKILNFLLKDPEQRNELHSSFNQHGFVMILLSRAVPILPEVTTVIAGMSGMAYPKFLAAWSISIIPYCLFAAYAGSLSTINSPEPAIIVWAFLSSILWTGWYIFNRKRKAC
ncbi:MAG: VTT domain-containing protein, partial [Kordiimonadaceae bacterium]|nr:VTT domain-containing protein [Kordiimonadaceae bacterium]